MKKILIISFSNLKSDPRVYRQILFLQQGKDYSITTVGYGSSQLDNINSITINKVKGNILSKIIRVFQLKTNQFESYYWSSPPVIESLQKLENQVFDLIISNDVNTLPLAIKLAKGNSAKVIFDAHEYEPRHFDDRWLFNFFFKEYWDYLCKKYLPYADKMTTVCQGIAEEYNKNYATDFRVLTNAPFFIDLGCSSSSEQSIRLIHHGSLNRSRRLENMIYLMDLLDERFTLDFMFIPNDVKYLKELHDIAKNKPQINFIDPVPMPDISGFINSYDMGIFLLAPNAFNYRMALPNKLFEFIQGRLGVATWPSPEMARIVNEYECGIVSEDFSIESIARNLNNCSDRDIHRFKDNSNKAAKILCAENNRSILIGLIESLI